MFDYRSSRSAGQPAEPTDSVVLPRVWPSDRPQLERTAGAAGGTGPLREAVVPGYGLSGGTRDGGGGRSGAAVSGVAVVSGVFGGWESPEQARTAAGVLGELFTHAWWARREAALARWSDARAGWESVCAQTVAVVAVADDALEVAGRGGVRLTCRRCGDWLAPGHDGVRCCPRPVKPPVPGSLRWSLRSAAVSALASAPVSPVSVLLAAHADKYPATHTNTATASNTGTATASGTATATATASGTGTAIGVAPVAGVGGGLGARLVLSRREFGDVAQMEAAVPGTIAVSDSGAVVLRGHVGGQWWEPGSSVRLSTEQAWDRCVGERQGAWLVAIGVAPAPVRASLIEEAVGDFAFAAPHAARPSGTGIAPLTTATTALATATVAAEASEAGAQGGEPCDA
ncbi:hypothetical protein ACIGO9_29800 [Nocardia asteroides]|uniref:hypothetical protein n=1 Tax=Nocardia asteroides TaxID=1824 RepID=UPI0037CCC246